MQDIELHQLHIKNLCADLVTENVIKTAYSTAPEKLDTAEIPALYSLTGSANEANEFGEKEEYITRIYRVQVAVLPIGQATPTERETLCRDKLEKVRKHLKAYPFLNACPRVVEASVLGDSGVVVLPEFGMKYVGFEIRLQVIYADEINFAEQE